MSKDLTPKEQKQVTDKSEQIYLKANAVKGEMDGLIQIFRNVAIQQDQARCTVLRTQISALLDLHLDLVQQGVDTILIGYGMKK